MNDVLQSSTSISPFLAITWCFYPFAILLLLELFLGGFDDDNDDQDGGMLVPAYSSSRN